MTRMDILAVVVTYNRIGLLKQCIDSLEKQTVPCCILVVDNAGTDGTEQYAALKTSDTFFYLRLPRNLGGAGGFNAGIRWGAERLYDYLWIMDDDSVPEPDALEALLEADQRLNGNYGWLSSRCLWTDGSLCPMNVQRETPYKDIKGFDQDLVPVQMASFVSLFLKADTVRMFGLPVADFVIWTDDWEYTRRISRKLPCYAVKNSVATHMMKNKTVVSIATDTPDRLERYLYFYRNDVVLYRREGIKGWVWLICKDIWHMIQTVLAGCPERIRFIVSGFCKGLRFYPRIEEVNKLERPGADQPD